MTALGDTLPPGEMLLSDSLTPALTDGSYTLTVTQTLTQGTPPVGTIDPITQNFLVSGPRFTLPAAEILTEYPPDGSTGSFGQYLPHVVLTQPQLPWERTIGSTATAPTPPWLALLLFEPSELVGANNGLQTMTVSALLNSPPANTRVPTNLTPTADELAMQCSVITLASATFAAIIPTFNELSSLAHIRQVDVTGKALTNAPALDVFSVVVANRFPAVPGDPGSSSPVNGQRTIVHLVSLEGFSDLLGGITPVTPTQASVMLVSLYSWTYTCLSDPSQTFASLAENLVNSGTPPTPRPASSLLLGLPYTAYSGTDPATLSAQKRLNSGYVPLGYHAQSGENGFAWYRGPFAPVLPNAVAQPGAFTTVAAAMIYDQTHGIFDHSLSTAWQCGQSLALADQTYATTLMALRQQVMAQATQMAIQGTLAPQSKQALVADRLQALFLTGVIKQIGQVQPSGGRKPRSQRQAAANPPHASLRLSFSLPEVRQALAAGVQNASQTTVVANWLGQLQLLNGVPFNHLVPNAAMLPAESIRFFFIDPNWIAALTAGALNIGIGTTLQAALQSVLTQQLEAAGATAALDARALSLNQTPPTAVAGQATSGLLIRSAMIAGWPGLAVNPTAKGTPVPILRVDLVAPDVLLCLFYGLPDTIVLEEPHEGLQFGVDDEGNAEWRTLSGTTVTSRNGPLIFTVEPPATGPPPVQPVSIRPGNNRVLNLNIDPTGSSHTAVDLLGLLAQNLKARPGPAQFALQMMQGPETVTFTLPALERSK